MHQLPGTERDWVCRVSFFSSLLDHMLTRYSLLPRLPPNAVTRNLMAQVRRFVQILAAAVHFDFTHSPPTSQLNYVACYLRELSLIVTLPHKVDQPLPSANRQPPFRYPLRITTGRMRFKKSSVSGGMGSGLAWRERVKYSIGTCFLRFSSTLLIDKM